MCGAAPASRDLPPLHLLAGPIPQPSELSGARLPSARRPRAAGVRAHADTAALSEGRVGSIRAATGAPRLSIVTHSMGALSARHCVRFPSGDGKVGASNTTPWSTGRCATG